MKKKRKRHRWANTTYHLTHCIYCDCERVRLGVTTKYIQGGITYVKAPKCIIEEINPAMPGLNT